MPVRTGGGSRRDEPLFVSRARTVAALAALLLVAVVPGALAAPSGGARRGSPAPLLGSALAGTSSYVGGTFVWTGYPYDDHDASYPKGLSNAANLVQLQLGLQGGRVHVRAMLETLLDPNVPVLGVAFDTDGDPATGAPSLPGGRWSPQGPLGVDALAVLRQGDSRLLGWEGAAWADRGPLSARVDAATNTIDATLPLSPEAAAWRVAGVLGVRDSSGHSWVDGGQPIADVAFRGHEPPSAWQHQHNDAILAGTEPSSHAVASVDFAAVAARTDRPADEGITDAGFHTGVYRSDLRLGEGIGSATLTAPGGHSVPVGSLYAGPYQPYLVWSAPNLPARPPVIVYMHGFTQNHLDNATSFGPVHQGGGVQGAFTGNGGFEPPAVVVMPLGRGENTFYIGAAEQDVLDATDDAVAKAGADPSRVVLSGISMGGFGTYRLGVRYPDRWSAAVPFIGTGGSAQYEFSPVPRSVLDQVFSPSGFPTGNAELLENLADLPMRMINGQVDPIVNNVLVSQDTLRLDQLGYDYRAWVLLRRQHEVVPSLSNCILVDAVGRTRAVDPAHVVLSVEPALFMHDPQTGLDLRYDRAYWVSGVSVRAGADKGTVDVTSLARADRGTTATRVVGAGQNLTKGADLCGPNPSVRTGDAWRELGIALRPALPQGTLNALSLSLTKVAAASLDLTRAGVQTSMQVTLGTTGDGPTTLRLRGAWPASVAVLRDGVQIATVAPTGDVLTISGDLSGSHLYRLEPAA